MTKQIVDSEYTWLDDLNDTLARTGYQDPEPVPITGYNPAPESGDPIFKAEQTAAPAQGGNEAPTNPAVPGVQFGGTSPGPVLPEKFQWVKNPEKLSEFLTNFNKRYPLNPSNAPQAVKDVYGNMKAPETNYGPPTGANADAAQYWANYFGYPNQYANNKVSVESKNDPNAWVKGSQAAGLNQVRPIAAEDVGFKFGDRKDGKLGPEDTEDFHNAMKDPNFNSMVSTMYARKVFNIEKGDPFKAEAGYNKGPYSFSPGEPWKDEAQKYVRNMFPGQWDGSMK